MIDTLSVRMEVRCPMSYYVSLHDVSTYDASQEQAETEPPRQSQNMFLLFLGTEWFSVQIKKSFQTEASWKRFSCVKLWSWGGEFIVISQAVEVITGTFSFQHHTRDESNRLNRCGWRCFRRRPPSPPLGHIRGRLCFTQWEVMERRGRREPSGRREARCGNLIYQ